MKKLISLFFLILLLFVTTQSFAQIKFGAKAGLNLSNMLSKDNTTTYSKDYKMKSGFHIGAIAEYPLSEIFSVESGLFLSSKGFKAQIMIDSFGFPIDIKAEATLYYLDIPITAKASYNIGAAKIYGFAGGYLGIGLSGKIKTEMSAFVFAQSDNQDVSWGSDENNDDFKRLDYGLSVGAGAEIQSFLLEVTYGLGLANLAPSTTGGAKENNRVIGISVGYKLGGKK